MNEKRNDSALFKNLRDKFEGHELPPDDSLWASISKDLEVSDSRFIKRKLIIWRSLSFLFLGLFLGFIAFNYIQNGHSSDPNQKTRKSGPQSVHEQLDSLENDKKMTAKSNKLYSSNLKSNLNGILNDKKSENHIKSNILERGSAIEQQTSFENKHPLDYPIPTKEAEGFTASKTAAIIMDDSAKTNSGQQQMEPHSVIPDKMVRIEDQQITSKSDSTIHELTPYTINDALLAAKHVLGIRDSISFNPAEKKADIKHPFFVRVGATPSYTSRFLTDNKDYGSTFYDKKFYDSRETGKLNTNYSLELGYQINEHFSIKTGIGRTNYSTSFTGTNTPVLYDTINGRFIAHTSNGQVEFNDTDFEGANEDGEQNNNNNEELDDVENGEVLLSYSNLQKISYIQIPLSIEAGITRNKFRYYLNAGLSFNFLTAQKVELTFDKIGIIRQENTLPIRKFNLGSFIGIGIEYRCMKKISVYIEPLFNYNFLSVNRSGSVKNNPYSLGTNLGLKIYF